MDFREMHYITTVADCRSVTAAAKKLYISQPSLSYIISKVEQDVGVKLFERKTYPLTLTYAGEKYVDTARKILLLNDNLRKELMDIGLGEKGKINFGMPLERAGYMLPRVVGRFKEQYPHVELRLQESKSADLLDALLKDEINFFIAPRRQESLPIGLKAEPIYWENLYLVTSPGNVTDDMLVPGKPHVVDMRRLKNQDYILLKRGHANRKRADEVLKRYDIVPNVLMEVSSCITAVQLADSGLGSTIVPMRALDALGGKENFCCYQYSEEPDGWEWMEGMNNSSITYLQVLRSFIHMMGEQMNIPLDYSGLPDYASMEEVQAMPAFPASGCCRMIDGRLLVKLMGY